MTGLRLATLLCDYPNCDESFEPGIAYAISSARKDARSRGWKYTKDRGDLCPTHAWLNRE